MKLLYNSLPLLLLLWRLVKADYTCLCSYSVELPVYAGPSESSNVLGYLYEFDCKPVLKSNDENGFQALQFEQQIGYILTRTSNEIQLCQGSVPGEDKVTTPAQPINTTTQASTISTTVTPFVTENATQPMALSTTMQNTSSSITSSKPATQAPTTSKPITQAPTTNNLTTQVLTTSKHTTQAPRTTKPITHLITTAKPTTQTPTTAKPTTQAPTTSKPSTQAPTTAKPSTQAPTTTKPITQAPTTPKPTTQVPTTTKPATQQPTTTQTTTKSTTVTITKATTNTPAPACRTGWIMHQGSCYLFKTSDRKTWNSAKSDCSHNHGYLVMIESQDEDTFLRNQLVHRVDTNDDDSDTGVWTGGSDKSNEGQWVWHNTKSGHDTSMTFTHWYPGEPDAGDHDHQEDCLSMIGDEGFLWQDYSCDKHMFYVCEAAPIVYPHHQSHTSAPGNVCGDGWDLNGNSCYLFHTGSHITWNQAAHICELEHAHLVFIETQTENQYLVNVLKQRVDTSTSHATDTGVWVGGLDHDVEGTWVWHNQATGTNTPISGYNNWHPGEPDGDHDHDEDCMCLIGSANFDWEDYSCSNHMYYVCEKELTPTQTNPATAHTGFICPSNWLLHKDSCYLFSTSDHLEWDDAASNCRHDDAYLVIIDSLDEEQFISGELNNRIGSSDSHDEDGAWTGGTDEHHDGYWVWKNTWTGLEMDISGYTNWLNGRTNPKDDHHDNDCMAIFKHTNFQWQDYRCRDNLYYVCEKPAKMPVPSLVG